MKSDFGKSRSKFASDFAPYVAKRIAAVRGKKNLGDLERGSPLPLCVCLNRGGRGLPRSVLFQLYQPLTNTFTECELVR
jgi:hypothetical protein